MTYVSPLATLKNADDECDRPWTNKLDEAAWAQYDAARDANGTAIQLAKDLRYLAARLVEDAARLENRESLPNPLGVVANRGQDIDRGCALLDAKLATYRTLTKMRALDKSDAEMMRRVTQG